jgi:hypothetical protein
MEKQTENISNRRCTMDRETAAEGKKPYHSPRLTVYGDFLKLTMGKGGTKVDTDTGIGSTKT